MKIVPFALEEFWKKYEFKARHILCSSNTESWKMSEILSLADSETKVFWENLSLGYTESPGLPLLREEIAKLYKTLNKDNILTFAGAEEGIYCLMQSLLSPKDHVVLISPCYQSLESVARSIGPEITTIKLLPEKKWKLSVEDLEKAFRKNTKLLIINDPHNPTGTIIEKDVYAAMIDLAKKSGAYIFSDEVYRYLELDESKRLPDIADVYEKGIGLNVMTKSFGLPGLRIGWLSSKDTAILEKANSYKLYTSICNSAPSEILALMALRAKERLLKRNRSIIAENLSHLDRFFEENPSFRWVRPESGPIGIVESLLPIPIDHLAEKLLNEKGVLIAPGSLFGLSGNYFRIGFGLKNMPEVLKHFKI